MTEDASPVSQVAQSGPIDRVLLLDFAGLREDARVAYAEANPMSAFARLAVHATTYVHASSAGAGDDVEYTDVFDAASRAGLLASWGGGASALLNEIHGLNPHGSAQPHAQVPSLFGARLDASALADADAQLATLLDALSAEGLAATTLVVLTSDAPQGAPVPLVLAGAGVRRGVVTEAVSTRQIAPTLAMALGLDPRALRAVSEASEDATPVLPSPPAL